MKTRTNVEAGAMACTARAVALFLLLGLAGGALAAEMRRLRAYTGGRVGSGIKIVKTDTDRSNLAFVVGVQDSDGRLKLIGFHARSDALERIADVRTGGVNPGGYFALAAARGMVVSAVLRHDGRLVLISWDARRLGPVGLDRRIERLETYTGEALGYPGRMDLTYMFSRDPAPPGFPPSPDYPPEPFHRFALLVRGADGNARVVIFDVHATTGAFTRRGEAAGGHVIGVQSIRMVYRNVVTDSDPVRLATAVTRREGLWIRLWHVDRDGNPSMAGSADGGTAYDVHLETIDKDAFFAAFAQSDGRPKLVTFVMSEGGRRVERGAEVVLDELNRERVPKLSTCSVGGSEQYVVLRNQAEELQVRRVRILRPQEIATPDTNDESGWIHILDCEVVGSYLIAAVKNSDNNLMVIQYRL